MTRLLATTALALALATGAWAQTTETAPVTPTTPVAPADQAVERTADSLVALQGDAFLTEAAPEDLSASEIIGATIYGAELESGAATADVDWDTIGEVNDILLSRDGSVRALLVDVGGFLGIGEKTVAVPMNTVKVLVRSDETADDWFLALNVSRATLEGAPAYVAPEDVSVDNGVMTTPAATTATTTSPATTPATTVDTAMTGSLDAVKRDGYSVVERTTLTTEDVTGAAVYGLGDEEVGTVSELLLDAGGAIDKAVIDVGGFMGWGAHPVAMSYDDLRVLRSDDGSDVRVYIDATKEKLEALPKFEG